VQEVWSKDLKYLWESDPINPGPIFFAIVCFLTFQRPKDLEASNIFVSQHSTFDIQHSTSAFPIFIFIFCYAGCVNL